MAAEGLRARFRRHARPVPPATSFREIIERAENVEWLRAELLRYHDGFGEVGLGQPSPDPRPWHTTAEAQEHLRGVYDATAREQTRKP